MNDMLSLMLAAAAGSLLGLFFFGGLWWTVRRALDSPRPALLVGGSLLLRMASVAAGFVVVSAGDWRKSLLCLLGFWAARWMVVRLTAHLPAEPPTTLRLSGKSANDRSLDSTPLDEARAQQSRSGGAM